MILKNNTRYSKIFNFILEDHRIRLDENQLRWGGIPTMTQEQLRWNPGSGKIRASVPWITPVRTGLSLSITLGAHNTHNWSLGEMYRAKLTCPSTYSCPQWHLAGGKCLIWRSVLQDGRGAEQLSCQSYSLSRRMLILISKLVLVPKNSESGWIFLMLSFALYLKVEFQTTWCPWEGKIWVDTAVTGMVGQGVAEPCGAPQQRGSAQHSC